MSDAASKGRPNSSAELTLNELQAVDPEILKELQEKYGLEIQVRSNSEAINQLLQGVGRTAALSPQEFTRGFDRTNPGYDKFYDRDGPGGGGSREQVTKPIENLLAVSLQEAIKSLSAEQLATIKKLHG